MHQQVEYFNNCTLCPYCIYVFCICLKQTATCAVYLKILLVFIAEMKSVYRTVRTEPLNKAVCIPSYKVKIFRATYTAWEIMLLHITLYWLTCILGWVLQHIWGSNNNSRP
jgi:hypothetical protein